MESRSDIPGEIPQPQKSGQIKNSTLILVAFATAFFPRFFSYFGAPSIIDFGHFIVIPIVLLIAVLTSRVTDRQRIGVVWELLIGILLFLICMTVSALLNQAGIINLALQFTFFAEPFMLLAAIAAIPMLGNRLEKFQYWLMSFALINLLLALAQSVLIPIGIYPKKGGTDEDAITGVFGGGGGSAANYVSCTVSLYFAIYFLTSFKQIPLWIRVLPFLGALYQIQISDSKQVFLALAVGWVILMMTKVEKPVNLLVYWAGAFIGAIVLGWILANVESEFLKPYQNWTNRPIWGWDGLAAQTKFAVWHIAPPYFKSDLNWLFGLGPGHTVTRLGGWVLNRSSLKNLLLPLGATIHPVSLDAWAVIEGTYLPQESTIFFPMFTWIGMWGDLGFVGVAAYIYLGFITWKRFCVDDFGKFLILSTASFGCILTQMEEPGHMLTVACLLALRWQEYQNKKSLSIRPLA
ncbi:MAG: hypothetical protein AAGD25_33710 [Cyanobacteria bacterium P01_F01_bin.150]